MNGMSGRNSDITESGMLKWRKEPKRTMTDPFPFLSFLVRPSHEAACSCSAKMPIQVHACILLVLHNDSGIFPFPNPCHKRQCVDLQILVFPDVSSRETPSTDQPSSQTPKAPITDLTISAHT